MKNCFNIVAIAILAQLVPAMAFAQEAHSDGGKGYGLIGAGVAMGLATIGGTLSQGRAVSASLESIGRNPGAAGSLFVPMLLGLAFIESLVVIAFVIAYLVVGKF